jgi:hypothetical protein
MKIDITRKHFLPTCTIGELSVDGEFLCITIEDTVRQIAGEPVSAWKIPKVTAIPVGTYPVQVTMSNRFKKPMPLLVGVEGFEGVRIHTGNTSEDTEGCIIVGSTWDGVSDFIAGSRVAFDKLFQGIESATDGCTLTIS